MLLVRGSTYGLFFDASKQFGNRCGTKAKDSSMKFAIYVVHRYAWYQVKGCNHLKFAVDLFASNIDY